MFKKIFILFLFGSFSLVVFAETLKLENPEIIEFNNGSLKLGGEIYKPQGKGPFPAILYNHGSAPGMLNSEASKIIGPKFAAQGWIFFMPYRRGQGLSSKAGPYIGDEINAARNSGGIQKASKRLVELMSGDHLSDQQAAYEWLKTQNFVDTKRIAVAIPQGSVRGERARPRGAPLARDPRSHGRGRRRSGTRARLLRPQHQRDDSLPPAPRGRREARVRPAPGLPPQAPEVRSPRSVARRRLRGLPPAAAA